MNKLFSGTARGAPLMLEGSVGTALVAVVALLDNHHNRRHGAGF